MAAARGMEVVVLRPDEYALPAAVMATAESAAAASGGSLRETATRQDALAGAHVVYAKSWSSPAHYGDLETEQRLRAGLRQWCVDETGSRRRAPIGGFWPACPW